MTPSIKQIDGIGCCALGGAGIDEPYALWSTQWQVETYSAFYGILVLQDTDPGGGTTPGFGEDCEPRRMYVQADQRDMNVKNANRTMVVPCGCS